MSFVIGAVTTHDQSTIFQMLAYIYTIFFIVHVIKKKHHNLCQKELRLKMHLNFNNVIIDHFIN